MFLSFIIKPTHTFELYYETAVFFRDFRVGSIKKVVSLKFVKKLTKFKYFYSTFPKHSV